MLNKLRFLSLIFSLDCNLKSLVILSVNSNCKVWLETPIMSPPLVDAGRHASCTRTDKKPVSRLTNLIQRPKSAVFYSI